MSEDKKCLEGSEKKRKNNRKRERESWKVWQKKKPGETLAKVSNFKQAIQNWRQIIIYMLIVSTSDLWYACANPHIQIYFPSGFSKLSIVWHNINLKNHYLFIHQSNLFCILRHCAAFPANCVFHHERRIPVCSISCILKP